MSLPLLAYAPSSQNHRVKNYDAPGSNDVRIFSTDNLLSPTDTGDLIEAAYRQIFFHAFAVDREPALESQLRCGQITVRQFIQGLLLSNTFMNSFYNLNSNYRFVEQCIQRVLGRDVYSDREKIAWSIVVATKGVKGFILDLVNSDEYLEAFGDAIVPYQRRRILSGRAIGETKFNILSPRYDDYHRAKLGFPQSIWQTVVRSYVPQERQARPGDPSLFLAMAQKVNPVPSPGARVSVENLNIEQKVPYRTL